MALRHVRNISEVLVNIYISSFLYANFFPIGTENYWGFAQILGWNIRVGIGTLVSGISYACASQQDWINFLEDITVRMIISLPLNASQWKWCDLPWQFVPWV